MWPVREDLQTVAHSWRKSVSAAMVAHLAAGESVRNAAELARVSERAADRLADPAFQGRVRACGPRRPTCSPRWPRAGSSGRGRSRG
jgi:hypothetical protein